MRIAVIALLAILVLGGAGAGAYFYFQQPAEASVGETPEHSQTRPEKGKGTDSHGHEFVELEPLILPIIDENGVSQVVSIVVVIEVADTSAAAEVTRLAPRLKDAFIQDMYGVLNKHAALQGGVIQVGAIKNRLNSISVKVLGEGLVEDVLLQVVQQRPI